jgi:hypothetical protein
VQLLRSCKKQYFLTTGFTRGYSNLTLFRVTTNNNLKLNYLYFSPFA